MDQAKFVKDLDQLLETGTVIAITLVPDLYDVLEATANRMNLAFDVVLNRTLFLTVQALSNPQLLLMNNPLPSSKKD